MAVWISKSIFAAIGGRKDRIIFLNDIIKIWKTWVVGSYKYCTIVGFLVLIVESVFTWDIKSFVDLCFEQQLVSRKDHKAKAQNNKCPSNSTPIEIYDLVEKHTRINRRKRKKNRRYLKQSDYENKQNKKYDRCNDYKYVVNLSSVNLNETEIKLLSKGLSFCPTPHKIDWIELKTDLSDFARRLRLKENFYGRESSEYYNPEDDNPFKRKSTWTPDKNREPTLDLFIHLITKDILNTKPLKIADNLTKQEREALKNLTERNDIVIKPEDKGKAIVIMDTERYKAECFRQLNNPKFYKQLPKDITHQVEDRIRIRFKR